jgi:hypothetical protein
MNQQDLFGFGQTELDLEAARAKTVVHPNPDRVRAKLNKVLAEIRAASEMPWDDDTLGYHQLVFPQMSRSLPEEEAAQLRFEFEEKVKRLLAA